MSFVKVGFTANTEATAVDMNQLETNVDANDGTSAISWTVNNDATAGEDTTIVLENDEATYGGAIKYQDSDKTLYFTNNYKAAVPTWEAIGAADPSEFECTVGVTVGDYATLGLAIAAGKVRILVIADTTETGDITLPSDCLIVGIGKEAVNIDMVGYVFLDNGGANEGFHVEELKITTSSGSGEDLFSDMNKLYIKRVYFDNNATANSCYCVTHSTATDDAPVILDCTLDLPNYTGSGLYLLGGKQGKVSYVQDLKIIGGGSSCRAIGNSVGVIDGITITGTSSHSEFLRIKGIVRNVFCYSSTGIYVDGDGILENCYATNNTLTIKMYGKELHNIQDFYSITFYGDDFNASNLFSSNQIGLVFNSASQQGNISNVVLNHASGDIVVASGANMHNFNNIQIAGAFSIVGNDITVSNARVGAISGGGSETITINVAATRTILVGCRADADIVDNSADAQIVACVTY